SSIRRNNRVLEEHIEPKGGEIKRETQYVCEVFVITGVITMT
ncbi:unnamed protein product, partial [Ascophyllum nodosum]